MNDKQIQRKAEEILSKMSLSDKIGQVTQITFNVKNIEESRDLIRKVKPGSLILCWSAMGGNDEQQSVCVESLNQLQRVAVEETDCRIPMMFGRDVIHGHRVAFPVPLTLTSSFDFELIEKCFEAIREEAADDGINWTFSPMLDISRDSRWGRIVEGSGEDPYLTSLYAKASIKGFQTDNVECERTIIACAKHFLGYGASEGGRDYNHTEISDYALQNYYLPPFKAAVDSGVGTVMASFNDINAIPVTGNRKILTEILRDQLGFKGFVVSDWNGILQLSEYCAFAEDSGDAAAKALNAGVDMDMVCNCYFDNIERLIKNGDVSTKELDKAVIRILETKLKFGLFEHPYTIIKGYDLNEHLMLAKQAAEKSIVLLKNNNNILPLKKSAKLGYAGNFRDEGEELVGTWSLDYDKSIIQTIRQGITSVAPNCNLFDCDDSDAYRITHGNLADAILLVIGEKRKFTGEAANVADISFSPTQKALLKALKSTNKPLIAVLCFARPIVFGKEEALFDAILYCGHGGTCASEAIASVLFGDAEPQGRLPFTLPYDIGQLPIYYNALPGSREINGYYGDVNYVHGDYYDCTGKPNFPFGFGLAYTEFEYSTPYADNIPISVEEIENGKKIRINSTVKNVGDRFGVSVAQLYVRDLCACRVRPLRMLKGFKRVELEAGESKDISFDIGVDELGFYLENGDCIIEKGRFEIYVGESSVTDNKTEIVLT